MTYRPRSTPNPHRLSIARDMRGLSIPELSERTQVSIERLEGAEKFVKSFWNAEPTIVLTEDEITRIAEALRLLPDFFYQHGERYPVRVCSR